MNQPHDGRTKASSQIQLRVKPRRKSSYVRAANRQNLTLAAWMFKVCDKESGYADEADAGDRNES